MKKGSIKNNRINQEVMKALTVILREEVKDYRVDPMLAVTRVEVTPDLQYCRVHVSTLGSDKALMKSIEGLESSRGFIRRQLAHSVNLRKTPELQFLPDRSMEYAMEMSMKIEALARAGGLGRAEDDLSQGYGGADGYGSAMTGAAEGPGTVVGSDAAAGETEDDSAAAEETCFVDGGTDTYGGF